MLLNALNIPDRLPPTFANEIKADLQLSNAQFGLLSGIMFTLLYGLLSPFMGLIADTVHRPRFAAAGVALWSLLTAASGAARGFVSLAIPRVFIGVGEATLTPTALSMVADRFPARRFGLASGACYAGVPLGAGLAFLAAATPGVSIGWRNCFFLIGGFGLVLAAIMAVQPDPRVRPTGGDARAGVRGMLRLIPELCAAMRRSPALPLTICGGVGVHLVDAFAAAGRERPITDMMLVMTAPSCVAIPSFLLAALRFQKDRQALADHEAGRG